MFGGDGHAHYAAGDEHVLPSVQTDIKLAILDMQNVRLNAFSVIAGLSLRMYASA